MHSSRFSNPRELTTSPTRSRLLRSKSDVRSLFWSLCLFPLPIGIAFADPYWSVAILPITLYLAFCAGALTHYHNHRGVFRSRLLNQIYSLWLSVFYGFPVFAWVPTHNQNHHKYTNGPLDATSTSRRGRPDSAYEALTYPTRSSFWQYPAVRDYFLELRITKRSEFLWCVAQILALVVVHAGLIGLFVWAHGLALGFGGYFFSLGLPALFSSWSMMFINYLQHVGCDPDSPNDHSRNFVGRLENWLVFDAGLHTIHHEEPGLHWSEYRACHEARASAIDPVLLQRNVFTFLWSRYCLGHTEHLRVSRRPSAHASWMADFPANAR